jgi:hypothetical protein
VIEIKSDAPKSYVVAKGDTLWDIASRFLKAPWYCPEIWHVNPQIENPHLIYPGDVLTLHYVAGRPYIQVAGESRLGGKAIKLSPRVRAQPLERDNIRLPNQNIQQFITHPRIVSMRELDAAPYIPSAQDDRLIYGSGDQVYVHSRKPLSPGDRYRVVRPGKPLIDPVTKESLGYECILVANARFSRPAIP